MPGRLLRLGGVGVPVQYERPAAGVSHHIPGVYATLMHAQVRLELDGVAVPDPRRFLDAGDLSTEQRLAWQWLLAEGNYRVEREVEARLAAGEPFDCPRWRFGGRAIPRDPSWPGWLSDPGVWMVRVHSDDTVAPADLI